MRRKGLALAVLMICSRLLAGCAQEAKTDKPVRHSVSDYPAFSLEYLTDDAAVIVHGTVKKAGKTFVRSVETSGGRTIEYAYTPYTIHVQDCLKGEVSRGKTVYHCPGGETEDMIYEEECVGEVEVGDEVLIFLHEENYGYGPESYGYGPAGVYIIEDGKTYISNQVLSGDW